MPPMRVRAKSIRNWVVSYATMTEKRFRIFARHRKRASASAWTLRLLVEATADLDQEHRRWFGSPLVVSFFPTMELFLVDGTYELFRHYYAVPSVRDKPGRKVGAVRAVLASVLGIIWGDAHR